MLENHWCASVDATIDLRTGCNPLEKHGPQAVIVHADAWAPLEAVVKLNESMNCLTRGVYLQIRALEEQGRTTEAAVARLLPPPWRGFPI